MKKRICLLLTLVMALSLSACGAAVNDRNANVSQGQTVSDILDSAGSAETPPTAENEATNRPEPETKSTSTATSGDYDVDLTQLSSTMVYSEVYNMVYEAENYIGKSVKIEGTFAVYEGEGRNYYACLIADAAACCSQGIEFVWKGDHVYPDDYPELGSEITVTGIFDTYMEDGIEYCQLIDAEMVG